MKKNDILISLSIVLFIALIAIYELSSQSAQAVELEAERTSETISLGSSWKLHVISSRNGGPDGVRLADVNDDGWMDVVTAFENSGDILIALHPGIERLNRPWPFVVAGNVPRGEDAFAIDLNGDGNMDIFSSHEGDALSLYVHWAPSDPEDYWNSDLWESERIEESAGHGWLFAVPMDVNEDGRVDIVAGSKDDSFNERNSIGAIAWLETPTEDREDWLFHLIDHAGWPMTIEPIDLDSDGDLDILLSDRNSDDEHQGLRWLENPGEDWDEEWKSHFVTGFKGERPMFIGLGDLDGDDIQDLAVPLDLKNEMAIVSLAVLSDNPSTGKRISVRSNLVTGDEDFKAAGIADIDLDGVAEIVLSTVGGNIGIGYFDQASDEMFNAWVWVPIFDALQDPKYDLITFYDVDGDGDEDILTTEENQGLGIIWLENPAISSGK
jgi:hypothetical protein